MTRALKQNQRNRLEAETNLIPSASGHGAQLSICLVSPSRYRTGMSSLGFQTIYALLAGSDGIRCERAFLPERDELDEYRRSGTPLLSLESQRPLGDFDLIAFSTSFEPDYLNIPLILKLARLPLYSSDRTGSHPLVLGGGAAFFINPEPVADFFDAICIGEGEDIIPALVSALLSPDLSGRQELLAAMSRIPGIYVPALYQPRYDGERLLSYEALPIFITDSDRRYGVR
jgi:radical SAM superfamily enzyme YgiQ (UPF0313 family)